MTDQNNYHQDASKYVGMKCMYEFNYPIIVFEICKNNGCIPVDAIKTGKYL